MSFHGFSKVEKKLLNSTFTVQKNCSYSILYTFIVFFNTEVHVFIINVYMIQNLYLFEILITNPLYIIKKVI